MECVFAIRDIKKMLRKFRPKQLKNLNSDSYQPYLHLQTDNNKLDILEILLHGAAIWLVLPCWISYLVLYLYFSSHFFTTKQSKKIAMKMKKVLRPKGNNASKLHVKNFLKVCIKLEYKPHKEKAAKSRSFEIRSKSTLAPVLCRIAHWSALCELVSRRNGHILFW